MDDVTAQLVAEHGAYVAYADLLVVEGDPLKDIGLLASSGEHLRLIMRAGEIVKSEIG